MRSSTKLAVSLILLTPACGLLSTAANAPSKIMGGQSKAADQSLPNAVQTGLMRFADTFAGRLTESTTEFARLAGTPEARIEGLSWSIKQSTNAFAIASGPNPYVAMLDMLVLVSLGRMVHEEELLPKVWGEADRPVLEAFQALETQAWDLAAQVLTKAQQDEVKAALRAWRDENPELMGTAFVRLPAFHDIVKAQTQADPKKHDGLADLLSVDPLQGLEPAVREVQRTRLFAERAAYYLQRAPLLLASQVELLTLKIERLPEVDSAVEVGQRISQAAASLAETAAKLPESVRVEREAAVKQVSDELSSQRAGLLADLEKSEEPTRKILTDARATFEAGAQFSTALQGATVALDGFIGGFESEGTPADAPPPSGPPARPFDITEYGDAATRVGATLKELNGVVTNLDRSLPQVQSALDMAVQRGNQTIDHAFERGVQLGAIVIGLAAIAALLVRWISARFLVSRAS